MTTRRRWLTGIAAALVGAPALGALYGWRIETHWVDFVERNMPIENLPRELDGSTVLHLSDLHVGPQVDEQYLTSALERAAALGADFVVYTGDFITYDGAERLGQLARVLSGGPRGRYATLASLGNHDYGRNWVDARLSVRIAQIAADAGIQVLRNQILRTHGVQFVGLDDIWARQFSTECLTGLELGPPTIALTHNPDTVDLPGWEPLRGWILAGHTHGGQCKLPFLPPPVLPVANRRYAAGPVDLGNGRMLYVNRGLGHSLPIRFNCRPEVTLFTLRRSAPVQIV